MFRGQARQPGPCLAARVDEHALHADLGVVSVYYASRTLLPAKTRAFVDFLVDAFRRQGLPERFSAADGKT